MQVFRHLPWLVAVAADLVVMALGRWLLASDGQLALAVLTPVVLAAQTAYEPGLETGYRVEAAATAVMAALQGFGPRPEPTWRTVWPSWGQAPWPAGLRPWAW